jgi:hypothetical protein
MSYPYHPIKSDSRYTITHEFTGHASGKPVHVLRFCGDFVDSSRFAAGMITRAIGHNAARQGALTFAEKTA